MSARLLAILLGVAPAATAWFVGDSLEPRAWAAWAAPALALALGIALGVMRRQATALALLAGGLAAAAGMAVREGRSILAAAEAYDSADWIDLTQRPMPATVPRYVALRGRLEPRWVLDEYAVAPGRHPDQSKPANAVLVPMLSDSPAEGPLVIVRLEPALASETGIATVRGRTEPLAPALLATFRNVAVSRSDASAGVLVDTFDPPARGRGWIAVTLGFIAAGAGLGCGWWAARRPPAA